jgi:transposase
MVTEKNIEAIKKDGHGFLVGIKRRRNAKLDAWLDAIDDSKWIDCPVGINARERKTNPPRTRAQEVASGEPDLRVFIIDSDERRVFEQAKREQAMERASQKLAKLKERVARGDLKKPEKIGAAAERIMQAYHGYRYFDWKVSDGVFEYWESETRLSREKNIEGKYVVASGEKEWTVLDALATYKELMDVESGFRQMKDVLEMRPIYHRAEPRVKAHIFVAALALLLQRLLSRRLKEHGVELSPQDAFKALSTVRLVMFRLGDSRDRRGVTRGCPDARLILKALKLVDQRPPAPPEGEETVK